MSEHIKCLLLCMNNMVVLLFTRLIMTHPVSWFFIRPEVFLKIQAHVLQNSPCKKRKACQWSWSSEDILSSSSPCQHEHWSKPWLFLLYEGSIILLLPNIYKDHIEARWCFCIYFLFSSLPGVSWSNLTSIFFKMGWLKPPTWKPWWGSLLEGSSLLEGPLSRVNPLPHGLNGL